MSLKKIYMYPIIPQKQDLNNSWSKLINQWTDYKVRQKAKIELSSSQKDLTTRKIDKKNGKSLQSVEVQ